MFVDRSEFFLSGVFPEIVFVYFVKKCRMCWVPWYFDSEMKLRDLVYLCLVHLPDIVHYVLVVHHSSYCLETLFLLEFVLSDVFNDRSKILQYSCVQGNPFLLSICEQYQDS